MASLPDVTPPWVETMRNAAKATIKREDVEEIIRNQVVAAKKGNSAAIKFVFGQLLGGEMKASTFVQNNYYDQKRPDKPAKALPGSDEKIALMQRRVAAGQSATNGEDAKRGLD